MRESYFEYWGKACSSAGQGSPFHLLPFHALDVAAVGAQLLERDDRLLQRLERLSGFSARSLRRSVPYLLALHDLGKFSEPFQDLKPEIVAQLQSARAPRRSAYRHDTLGYLLWRSWSTRQPHPSEADLFKTLVPVMTSQGPLSRRDARDVVDSWMAAILGHHGKPPQDASLPQGIFGVFKDGVARSRTDAAAFALAARELLDPGGLEAVSEDLDALEDSARRSSWWLAGFAIVCDWLGSNTAHFPYEAEKQQLGAYWARARDAAAHAVAGSGLIGPAPRPFGGFAPLFPAIARSPSPLQVSAASVELGDGPQLFVLEDLTGSGKTEAALVLAHRLMSAGRGDGLFFALPTMATANAMAGRVQPLLERLFDGPASFVLAHSGPGLADLERISVGNPSAERSYGVAEEVPATRAAASWLSDNRKKALLADLGVGTIDQALLAALQSRHAALRLFGLQRHVLVVDEVHACDAYMHEILCELIEAHAALGGSVILLSATLPQDQRAELIGAFAQGLADRPPDDKPAMEYPLLTAYRRGRLAQIPIAARAGSSRRVNVGWLGTPEETIATVAGAARSGQCVCWVRNSVADALEAYDALLAALGADRVTLFHARFALRDRLRIERDVVRRFGIAGGDDDRRGRVVVATQVVEQSLDIDFDAMVTDLCPVDLVIQRAGRLQRHAERHPGRPFPTLLVLAPPWSESPPGGWLGGPFRRTAAVYGNLGILWRTARALRVRGSLDLPRDARALIEAVYGNDDVPASLEPRSNAVEGQELARASVAQNATIKLKLGYVRVGQAWADEMVTPTRLGEPTTTVRLARCDDGGARAWADDEPERLRWPSSQVSVARRLVTRAHPDDERIRHALAESQPFLGDDVCTVLLHEERDGVWVGRAIAERVRGSATQDVSVRVRYSATRGLEVAEGA
jgi:CRISPR-associated endonuclease/helicase Cas3